VIVENVRRRMYDLSMMIVDDGEEHMNESMYVK
jgi:hypothetical protein